MSKEHARLLQSPAGVLLEDGGSFGGVLVNGQRIDVQYGGPSSFRVEHNNLM
ncbi:FHA domain-containing protein [Verminephrobacter aporrectodeae]|uniref:FHA domain-containing protein n=1 Tax=Verminephrobacter aporrectodeae TaxID=1110389 RepID=UPI00224438DD|nr:FHA domain-containing protein [Verminephrobacter aporrectodeae]